MGALTTRHTPNQVLRFLIVGTANTVLSYSIYAAGIAIGLPFQVASLLALVIGIGVSFLTQGRLVFVSRLQGRFFVFAGLWAVLYFATITLIGALNWAGLDYYLAGFVVAVPITAISFVLQKQVVFAERRQPALRLVLFWMLAMLAVARLDLTFRFEANWDEFLNLAMIYSHQRGTLQEVLQTAFIHLFSWVEMISTNEVDQVIAARLPVFGLAIVTSFAIYGTARRFMDVNAALVAVVAFNGFSFVLRHGVALRTDPAMTCAMMIAIWLAVAREFTRGRALGLGAMVGFAGALTIKAVFYLPLLGGILLLRIWYHEDRKRTCGLVALSILTALVSFVGIIGLHAATFADPASPLAFVARTSGATMLGRDYSILLEFLRPALTANVAFWFILVFGILRAIALALEPVNREKGLMLLTLSLPLLSPLVYRDVYPYYYPFMLAPAAVLAGFGISRLFAFRSGLYAWLALTIMALTVVWNYSVSLEQQNSQQRRVLAEIHRLFPQEVPYIDHTSMVASFPKQGFFMSRWGMTDYRNAGQPVMAAIIAQHQPRFLLATRALLNVENMDPEKSQRKRYGLLAEDVRALKANYLRYWGPIYLPGFRLHGNGTHPVSIAGRYKLEASGPVTIDNRSVYPDSMIELSAGDHRYIAEDLATFRWAAPPPPGERIPTQLFIGF